MSWRRVLTRAGALAVAAAAGIACGDDGGRFDDQVAEVRSAVEDGDHARGMRALEDLGLDALAARDDGTISDAEMEEVASLIDSSRALLEELVPPPTTTTTEAPPTTVEQRDDPPDDGEGRGNGRDHKDKDEDKDHEDDD